MLLKQQNAIIINNMENNEEEALKSQEDFNNELIKQIQKDNVGDNIETFIYKEKKVLLRGLNYRIYLNLHYH